MKRSKAERILMSAADYIEGEYLTDVDDELDSGDCEAYSVIVQCLHKVLEAPDDPR